MPPGYYYAKPAEHGYATPSGYYVTSLPQAMRHAPVANLYPRNHIRLQIGLHPLGFQPAYPTPPPAPAPVGSFQQTNHAAQPNVFVCTHACGYVASFGNVPVGPVACVCGKPMAPAPPPGQFLAVQTLTLTVFLPPQQIGQHAIVLPPQRVQPSLCHHVSPQAIINQQMLIQPPQITTSAMGGAAMGSHAPTQPVNNIVTPSEKKSEATQGPTSNTPPVNPLSGRFRGNPPFGSYDLSKTTLLIKGMPKSMSRNEIWAILQPFSSKIDYVFWPNGISQRRRTGTHIGLLFVNFKDAKYIPGFCNHFRGEKPGRPWLGKSQFKVKTGKETMAKFRGVFKKLTFQYAFEQGFHKNIVYFVQIEERRRDQTKQGGGKKTFTPCELGPYICDPVTGEWVNLIRDDGSYQIDIEMAKNNVKAKETASSDTVSS